MEKLITLGIALKLTEGIGNALKKESGEAVRFGRAMEEAGNKKLKLGAELSEIAIKIKTTTGSITKLDTKLDELNNTKLKLKEELASTPEKADAISAKLKIVERRKSSINDRKLKLQKELYDAQKSGEKLNNELKETDKRLKTLSNSSKHLANIGKGSIQMTAIGEGLRRTIVMPMFDAAIGFESAMADVNKVVSFDNVGEAKAFQNEILKLSRNIPIAQEGLAAIAASGGQLGIAKEKLLGFTEGVAKMSTAFDMSPDAAGEATAKLMNIYGLSLEQVTSLGDAVNHLSDNTAAKAKDIVDVLARVGGTAKTFGLSAEAAAALGDSMLAMGKPAEVAATGINAMLMKLKTADKQSAKFQTALQDIGMDAQELKDAIENDAQGAVLSFLEALDGVDKDSRLGIMSDMFGMEYADDIALIVSGIDNYKKAIGLTADKTAYAGSMQKEFINRSKTTSNQLELLGNGVKEVGINIGTLLLPPLVSLVNTIKPVVQWMAEWAQDNPKTAKVIGIVGVSIVGLGLAIGATSMLIGIMGPAVTAIGAALSLAKIAVLGFNAALIANPIGLVVVAVGALVAGVVWAYNTFEWFKSGVDRVFEGIKAVFKWSPLGLMISGWGVMFDWLSVKFEWFRNTVETVKGLGASIASVFGFGDGKVEVGTTGQRQITAGVKVKSTAAATADAVTKNSTNSSVKIDKVEINNPKSDVDVERAMARAMDRRRNRSYSDEEV